MAHGVAFFAGRRGGGEARDDDKGAEGEGDELGGVDGTEGLR